MNKTDITTPKFFYFVAWFASAVWWAESCPNEEEYGRVQTPKTAHWNKSHSARFGSKNWSLVAKWPASKHCQILPKAHQNPNSY